MQQQITAAQIGLWILGLIVFVYAISLLFKLHKGLTKDFVTKPEMESALLRMESGIERQIETTRHALRNEVNSAFVRLENKVELISEKQATTGEAIARIETILLNGHKTQ